MILLIRYFGPLYPYLFCAVIFELIAIIRSRRSGRVKIFAYWFSAAPMIICTISQEFAIYDALALAHSLAILGLYEADHLLFSVTHIGVIGLCISATLLLVNRMVGTVTRP